ncbi:MAG: FAD-dependent oxidoreductase, partial [Spirochaetia bacterium]|nr:FAD-dependent oxidoreductase [Spirochaetia bacterium]
MPHFDIAVIGAGHAGIEAALAAARIGLKTALFTINADRIGLMSCNPAVGGLAKGQLVREIDALGGQMALTSDAACIQFKVLNSTKGPAVRGLRAQADKKAYTRFMKNICMNTPNLTIIEAMVDSVTSSSGSVDGVTTSSGEHYPARAVVV